MAIVRSSARPSVETVTFDGRAMAWEFEGIEDGQILIWAPMQGDYYADLNTGRLVKTRNWWLDEDSMRLIRAFCKENSIPFLVLPAPRPLTEVFEKRRARRKSEDERQLRMFE